MRRRSARITGGALAVVIAAMLTGCFANPLDAVVDQMTENNAKDAAESIIEGMGGGEVDVSFGELPANFPADVKLVSQNITQSMAVAEGMVVIVTDPRSKEELVEQVTADFAGWEEVAVSDFGVMYTVMYKKGDALTVSAAIMAGDEEEDSRVNYTVIVGAQE